LLQIDRVLQVRGRLSVWNSRPTFDAFEARPAEELRALALGVEILFECGDISEESLRSLKEICNRYGGKRTVRLRVLHGDGFEAEWRLNGKLKVMLSDDAIKELAQLPGRPKMRFFTS
jgi:hypothetical protein